MTFFAGSLDVAHNITQQETRSVYFRLCLSDYYLPYKSGFGHGGSTCNDVISLDHFSNVLSGQVPAEMSGTSHIRAVVPGWGVESEQ